MVKGEDGGQGGVRKERDKFQGEREREEEERMQKRGGDICGTGREKLHGKREGGGVNLKRREKLHGKREKEVELARKDREELHGKKDWTG